ncbi:MAG: flagellar basal body P-ring protein FlgI [Pseudomonadota bacterium]
MRSARRIARLSAISARSLLLTVAAIALGVAPAIANPRIKDLVEIEGVRGNDLVGYGLVVGLDGTGDGIRNAPFTEEALQNLLERLGINVSGEDFRTRNVAAVIVTAALPPFARAGSRIDVSVAAIGDAESLLGGTLVMTPLNAADGEIYAVAQGPILASGFGAGGAATLEVTGVPTAGAIPGGARVEREVTFAFETVRELRLALRDPDFTTAARIAARINATLNGSPAQSDDPGTVRVALGETSLPPAATVARIENLTVSPASKARVVIDQRSGTIVLGADVKISRVAVSQGNLTIRVEEQPLAAQPNPFADGESILLPRTNLAIDEGNENRLALVERNVTLADLVGGLNALGVGPRDMIDILKAIDAAGALHAELIVN